MRDPSGREVQYDPGEPPELDEAEPIEESIEKPVTRYAPGPWLRQGTFIYSLMETGRYRRGLPELTNRFSVNIQHDPRMPLEELEATARLIHNAPGTYEALKGLSGLLAMMKEEPELDAEVLRAIDAAELAIVKAEGST
jgi:hypothetical protein